MNFTVSDLLFPGFPKFAIRQLSPEYGIEFFYEFGKDYYWNAEIAAWGKRSLSIHGPCVALNLADPSQTDFDNILAQTFAYAKKCSAEFVVVHTNEGIGEDIKALQELVISRLHKVMALAKGYGVQVVIENVGLRTKANVLFTLPEYLELFKEFPEAMALIDTGHAHVNGWDLAEVTKTLGSKLLAFHVHDNDGNGDDHLPVGMGNTDWKSFFAAVKEYAPNATLVLEYCCGFKATAELEAHIAELKVQYGL